MKNIIKTVQISEFDNRPILESVPLKPHYDRDSLSRYEDSFWDVSPAVFRENVRRCHVTVNFDSVEDLGVREATREILYAKLNISIPGHRKRISPTNVRQSFNRVRRFFEFVREDVGVVNLTKIDQKLLDRYHRHLKTDVNRRSVNIAQLLEIAIDLYAYRDHLPSGGLNFLPWEGRAASHVAGARTPRENLTPRIPEDIMSPLLAWSIRYITIFSNDILAAREELEKLQLKCNEHIQSDLSLSPKQQIDKKLERLKRYINQIRKNKRGVPIWSSACNGARVRHLDNGELLPPINSTLINLHIGAPTDGCNQIKFTSRLEFKHIIKQAIQELGLELGGMNTPISLLPETGLPWRQRFDAKSLAQEEKMLQAAAYIVCSYLTGMRDCEVQAMQRGCLTISRSEDGLIMRHKVKSVIYKGKNNKGEEAEWVTIEPVATAINVLEKLSYQRASAKGIKTLWPVLSNKRTCKDHISAEIVRQLNKYRDHINNLFGVDGKPVVPNGQKGKPWRITTRQFRRTIAWHIANRPFGTIAGKIQYKHASIAAFEGYAGYSSSGFQAEIQSQRALGQLDDILTYFDSCQSGSTLTGPAAVRLSKQLESVASEIGPLPAMIADRARLRKMLASIARTLHVGLLADCFFDPAHAVCLKQAGRTDGDLPLISLCQPTQCPNACITERHRNTWETAAKDVHNLLKEKRMPKLQRKVLEQDAKRIQSVLDGLKPS